MYAMDGKLQITHATAEQTKRLGSLRLTRIRQRPLQKVKAWLTENVLSFVRKEEFWTAQVLQYLTTQNYHFGRYTRTVNWTNVEY